MGRKLFSGWYARETNPGLKQQQVIYYRHATSCGTETAVSVPCMFSRMARTDYDTALAHHQERGLYVMAHAGVNLLWRENDGGCKVACDRIPHSDITRWQLKDLCRDGYCQDEVLLHRLNRYIDCIRQQNTLIVLHQIGSHGPAYYLRYPASMRQFTPSCDCNQIQDCDRHALTNTYDNTLLYTDTMPDDTIRLLNSYRDRYNVALIYLSDHGESLGERGMYLHGTPWMFAPSQQTHIPMLLWLSPEYAAAQGIDQRCLRQQAQNNNVSQNNVFHTLLGMINVETNEYHADMDMIRSCRQP